MIINQLESIANEFQTKENPFRGKRGVVGVQVSKSGHIVVVRPRVNVPSGIRPSFSDRKEVTAFSASSATRMRRYLRECLPEYCVMVTLTYPHGLGFDGERAKRDLKVFLQRLRRKADSMHGSPLSYSTFWFFEFQERGAVHFHLFTTHFFPKEWIAKSWYEIVGSEDERHLHAGTRIESIRSGKRGISAYASKYAAKQTQKVVPEDFGWTGRFWGVSGYRATVAADTWLEPEDLGSLTMRRHISNLESAIYKLKREGKITVHPKDGGTFVLYCRSLVAENELTVLINKCYGASAYQSCGNKGVWWPELEVDYGVEVLQQA